MVWIFIGQVANEIADYSSHMLALSNFTELQSKKEDIIMLLMNSTVN